MRWFYHLIRLLFLGRAISRGAGKHDDLSSPKIQESHMAVDSPLVVFDTLVWALPHFSG